MLLRPRGSAGPSTQRQRVACGALRGPSAVLELYMVVAESLRCVLYRLLYVLRVSGRAGAFRTNSLVEEPPQAKPPNGPMEPLRSSQPASLAVGVSFSSSSAAEAAEPGLGPRSGRARGAMHRQSTPRPAAPRQPHRPTYAQPPLAMRACVHISLIYKTPSARAARRCFCRQLALRDPRAATAGVCHHRALAALWLGMRTAAQRPQVGHHTAPGCCSAVLQPLTACCRAVLLRQLLSSSADAQHVRSFFTPGARPAAGRP